MESIEKRRSPRKWIFMLKVKVEGQNDRLSPHISVSVVMGRLMGSEEDCEML